VADQQQTSQNPAAPAQPQQPAGPTASWPPPEERVHVGKSIKRLDGPDKAQGRAKYSYDITRPGMLYAKLLDSPHAHARVRAIDLSAAEKLPGVRAVLALKDPANPETARVRYAGEEVAAVAAVTEEIARDAIRLIKVDYEVLPHLATVEQAMRPEAPLVFEKGNTREPTLRQDGDIDAGFKAAAQIVEGLYSTQVQTHTSLETHGGVCEWNGENLTAWVSTQSVHGTREGTARALNIPQTNVRVITDYMGGGFGSKLGGDLQVVIAARLAKLANAPVKLMLDRKEEHLVTGNRPSAYAKLRAGVDASGKLVAIDAETWGTGGAGQGSSFPVPYQVYPFPNRRQRHTDVYINAGPQRAFRAPGHPQSCFVTEIVMDELADRLRMDPLELRLRNLPPEADNAQWGRYFKMGAERFGWNRRHPTGDPASGPIKRGMGCAANRWGGSGSNRSRAACQIHPDGSVVTQIGTQDIGTGTRTLVAIVTAETMGLPIESVRAAIGDSNYPWAPGSGGSVTAPSVASIVRVASENARRELFVRVAPALNVSDPATLVARQGRVHVEGDPSKGMTWKEACKLIGTDPIDAPAVWQAGLSSTGTSGVQFADVEVDIETGVTRVRRIVCVQDCGMILDKLTAESQCYGGIIMGLGFALFESRILDRNTAQMVNPNMEWYLLPGMSDVPEIDVTLVDQPTRGVVGLGEPPVISTAAAIGNAVANAIGVRVRTLPLTPAAVLGTLEREKAGGTL
jgi:xanthine dehydrogenase YagR molybdenum-binding subunit